MKKTIIRKKKSAKKAIKRAKIKTKKRKASTESIQENDLSQILKSISINARRRAFRKNASVTIIREGKIIKILPSGVEKVIGKIKKKNSIIDPKRNISLN